MNRRRLVRALALAPAAAWVAAPARAAHSLPRDFEPLHKPDSAWRELLTTERYRILFEDGTEPAFTSPLNDEKRPGTYVCAACRLPLFRAEHKFDSGTGWPSFTRPIEGAVDTRTDWSMIWPRTEYHCARCGGHQGHVFDDGPEPRGERWCNNGLALRFVPADQPLPELRA